MRALLCRRAEEITELVDKTQKERMEVGTIDIGLLLEPIDIDKYDFIRLSANGAIMVQNGLGYSLVVEGSIPFWDNRFIRNFRQPVCWPGRDSSHSAGPL